jgi:hypothetical protein
MTHSERYEFVTLSTMVLHSVRRPGWIVPSLLIVAAVVAAVPVVADDGPSTVDRGVVATASAEPSAAIAVDMVSVSDSGTLDAPTATKALAAARAAGASSALGRAVSVGMVRVRRGSSTVQAPPSGWAIPMGTTVLPNDVIARTMGRNLSSRLTSTTIVMGALSASLRGARVGDVVTLRNRAGNPADFTIVAIAADDVVGGTEILMSDEGADRIGLRDPTRVVIWGFGSRSAINNALAAQGLVSTKIRIRRSWDPFDPDLTIGMAETKRQLGEFPYLLTSSGVAIDGGWIASNLPPGRRLLSSAIPISARCHVDIEPGLRAALGEVAAAGLGGTIDVRNANTYGGCFAPRFNRLTPDSAFGFLSRHTWAMAIDMNTVGSCQGCAPPDMNCTVVRIFRKHGFAWGGNFLVPDGMHFEWVGERRDRLPYPSRFCANTGPFTSALDPSGEVPPEGTQRATMFADDGLVAE